MKGRALSHEPRYALNAICPYFTMFPLGFPLQILAHYREAKVVVDPFCGRGTTLFAARLRGLRGVGIDVSPVAVAISQAKLSYATVADTLTLARRLLRQSQPQEVPEGAFWRRAFHKDTLREICTLREALGRMKSVSDEAALLRGTLLGVLHGPLTGARSYLSNQMPRTFSPKPAYAVKFWKARGLVPASVSVLSIVERKLGLMEDSTDRLSRARLSDVRIGDAANKATYRHAPRLIDLVITSPPYYGMRTYVPDQWLRSWFLGGPPSVDYSPSDALPSSSPDDFAEALGHTWSNLAVRARGELNLHVRFGSIPSRAVDAKELLARSLESSGVRWRIVSTRNALNADAGKRQARHMRAHAAAVDEIDLHAVAV